MGNNICYYRVKIESMPWHSSYSCHFNLYKEKTMNGNNQNPKGGNPNAQNPNAQKQGQGQHQGQQKQGQPHQGKPEQKQGQAANPQPEQKKNGWCGAHKGPKGKCNCE